MVKVPDDKSPPPLARMCFHAALAAIVFFSLNRFALDQTVQTSLVWGAVAAPFAAYLAYIQSRQ